MGFRRVTGTGQRRFFGFMVGVDDTFVANAWSMSMMDTYMD